MKAYELPENVKESMCTLLDAIHYNLAANDNEFSLNGWSVNALCALARAVFVRKDKIDAVANSNGFSHAEPIDFNSVR